MPVSTRPRKSWARRGRGKKEKEEEVEEEEGGYVSNLRHKDKKKKKKKRLKKKEGGIYERHLQPSLSFLSLFLSSFSSTFHFLLFGFIRRDFEPKKKMK